MTLLKFEIGAQAIKKMYEFMQRHYVGGGEWNDNAFDVLIDTNSWDGRCVIIKGDNSIVLQLVDASEEAPRQVHRGDASISDLGRGLGDGELVGVHPQPSPGWCLSLRAGSSPGSSLYSSTPRIALAVLSTADLNPSASPFPHLWAASSMRRGR